MFNPENSEHLLRLKDEVNNDPTGRGYSSLVDVTQDLLDSLNDQDAKELVRIPLSEMEIVDVLVCIDSDEYDSLSNFHKEAVLSISQREPSQKMGRFATMFEAIFPPGSKTREVVDSVRSQTGSRAEYLFGKGTELVRADWLKARYYNG